MASYRRGNYTATNMTPRLTDLAGLSATNTVPVVRACAFDGGRPGIEVAGHGFITTDDPTGEDALHFLITPAAGWLLTLAQWAAGRVGILGSRLIKPTRLLPRRDALTPRTRQPACHTVSRYA
jgi:hypothetical protein